MTVTIPNGVTSVTSSADQFTYVAVPTVTSVSPNIGPTVGGTTVVITGTGFVGATEVQFDGTAAASFTVNSSTQITATSPAGSGVVDVTVTIPVGVTSAASSADQFTYVAAPTVTGVSPNNGPAAGGASVIITGTNFTSATAVKFGATSATTFTINSDSQITAIEPAGAGVVDVTVTIPISGTSAISSADHFTYAPAVTGVSPNIGPSTGSTSVIITGTGFSDATAVQFGSTSATSFTVNSSTQITTASPAGVGVVDVTVTIPVGGTSATSSSDDFTYVPAPTVSAVSPSSGYSIGGAVVTITGTNLSGATAVSFGSNAATTFTVNSATQITATAPAGSVGTVNVTVTTVGGTSATSSSDDFTYTVSPPTVTALSPTFGPTSGGTSVTITGTNFIGVEAVYFGATAAASFTVVNPTHITCSSPAGTAGLVNVTVVTAVATSATSSSDGFSYEPPGGFLVTNTSNNAATPGSLPWAVAQANSAATNATITFAPAVFSSATAITLASTLN